MDHLSLSAVTLNFAAWIAPIVIIVAATLVGWVVEWVVTRWVRRMARRVSHREGLVARALRGHITFWGLLLGVGLAADTVDITRNSRFGGYPIGEWIHSGLLALFVISLTIMLSGVITAMFVAPATARPVVSLVTNLVRFVVLAIGFMLVMSVFGVSITPWLTTLGVAGLAVSLALQATLTDLVSGMLLLASRQIAIGEYIKLSTGEEGYVSDITWRTTTIRQLSNNVVIVPNSKMTSLLVTNYHTETQRCGVNVEVAVSYASDLDQVERVTVEVAEDVMKTVPGGVPDFQPSARFSAFGDYNIRFSANMQAQGIADQYLIKHEFIKRLRRRFSDEGIAMPYLSQTAQLRDSGEEATAPADGMSGQQAPTKPA